MSILVSDEMVDLVVDEVLRSEGLTVVKPDISDSDDEVLDLARDKKAVVLTRDRDFVRMHKDSFHYGIIFDPGMHHRNSGEVASAVLSVLDQMGYEDLENSLVRLNRFY